MEDDQIKTISSAKQKLLKELSELKVKTDILKSKTLKTLFEEIKNLDSNKRASFGKALNDLKNDLLKEAYESIDLKSNNIKDIDVSSPLDINQPADSLTSLEGRLGSTHPVMSEMDQILTIFQNMGFNSIESYEIDDDFHMFESLNFPLDHPARDDFDTFILTSVDQSKRPLVAAAQTSTMQNRVIKQNANDLIEKNKPIAYVIPGRVFRKEDLDARHEHTFYQIEGLYIAKKVTVANLIDTLRQFMSAYFNKELELKTQPFYFPFTEPSFEFAVSCPFCAKGGCNICSYSGWIELLGCGMIHPNVLKMASVDPAKYSGFAFGIGFMRMVMIKYNIEDIRHFFNGKLDFLRQFN